MTSVVNPSPLTLVTETLSLDFFQSFSSPPLKAQQVHLWVASLRFFAPLIPQILPFLSHQDRENAGRFYAEADRQSSLVSRGVLRRLLGGYLRLSPGQTHLCDGKNGKPEVLKSGGLPCPSFNVSHSDDLLLFAFSRYRNIGVDVEHICPMNDYDTIAAQFFHPMEVAWLNGVANDLRLTAFYDLWTKKEAYVKATGEGLSHPLDSFSVVREMTGSGRFLVEGDRGNQTQGIVVIPAPDYRAAVVVI